MTHAPTLIGTPAAPGAAPAETPPPLRVVGVSGSLHEPSKTTALVEAIVGSLVDALSARGDARGAARTVESRTIQIAQLGPAFAGALRREDVSAEVEDALRAIETADVLVVASPVYRASYTGLFKHLFDFVEQYALVGTPVIVAATGGGERHALILEHQLRPLFGFFQALTLPVGVYASAADFDGYVLREGAVRSRIQQAVTRGLPLIAQSGRVSEYVSTW